VLLNDDGVRSISKERQGWKMNKTDGNISTNVRATKVLTSEDLISTKRKIYLAAVTFLILYITVPNSIKFNNHYLLGTKYFLINRQSFNFFLK
jgi:hypothetical protein